MLSLFLKYLHSYLASANKKAWLSPRFREGTFLLYVYVSHPVKLNLLQASFAPKIKFYSRIKKFNYSLRLLSIEIVQKSLQNII